MQQPFYTIAIISVVGNIETMSISELIKSSGLSDKELAAAAGVDKVTAWRWRTGKGKPNFNQIASLASALGLHPADLIPRAT